MRIVFEFEYSAQLQRIGLEAAQQHLHRHGHQDQAHQALDRDQEAVAQQALGLAPGESTPDGLFTLESVQCLCACDRAPTLQINKEDYFKVTPAKLKELLAQLQTEGVKLGPPVGWLAEQHHAHA